jgi:hypothetical protein
MREWMVVTVQGAGRERMEQGNEMEGEEGRMGEDGTYMIVGGSWDE